MRAIRLLFVSAVLLPTMFVSFARQQTSVFEPDFTKRLAYKPGKEILLDAAVGRLQFENIRIVTKEKKDGTLLKVLVSGYSKARHDYDVTIRVLFEDANGKILGTAMGRNEIEEDEDGAIKADVLIPNADRIESVTLEISVSDD